MEAQEALAKRVGLNPFEVREVLQVVGRGLQGNRRVLIPLKSGRCCKMSEVDYFMYERS